MGLPASVVVNGASLISRTWARDMMSPVTLVARSGVGVVARCLAMAVPLEQAEVGQLGAVRDGGSGIRAAQEGVADIERGAQDDLVTQPEAPVGVDGADADHVHGVDATRHGLGRSTRSATRRCTAVFAAARWPSSRSTAGSSR